MKWLKCGWLVRAVVVFILGGPVGSLFSETYGDLVYRIIGDEVIIDGHDCGAADVVIPADIEGLPVTSISNEAFADCTALESVRIPGSVTLIGERAFYDCSNLIHVELGEGIEHILLSAFSGCVSLAELTLPSSLKSVYDSAFRECDSLEAVTIPENLTTIAGGAFRGKSLTNFHVHPDNPSYASVDGVLFNKAETELVQFPSGRAGAYAIPVTVESLASHVFVSCEQLTHVTIPNGITAIPNNAFWGCKNLQQVNIPSSVESIGELVFAGCDSLTRLTLPEGFKGIGAGAFWGAEQLETVILPSTLGSIGWDAFYNSGITQIDIPEGVTAIGNRTFKNCTNLTTVTLPTTIRTIGYNSFENCVNLANIELPSSVTTIERAAFAFCERLPYVDIPEGVVEIEDHTFTNCYSLADVNIPDSVTNIGLRAFFRCMQLETVSIPASITGIEYEAFSKCEALTSMYFLGDAPQIYSLFSIPYPTIHIHPDAYSLFSIPYPTIHIHPDATGWKTTYGGAPTVWIGGMGFLDEAVGYEDGWLSSPWLGWFQLISRDGAAIEHLLLGSCYVRELNASEYWIRTEGLGWIYMHADLAPWFWRVEDGHWYWLDMDGWPPRAWDSVTEEWIALNS